MILINSNDIEVIKSRLKILRDNYIELISYDKPFKNQKEQQQYMNELDSLKSKIMILRNILIDNQERK